MSQYKTSLTLLNELCRSPTGESWERLVELYAPLLRNWIRRYDVQDSDADDLVQDVLVVVLSDLSGFQHNQQPGAFRRWLRIILVNRLRNFWRKRDYRPLASGGTDFLQQLNQLEDARSQLSRLWDHEHDRHVLQQLLSKAELKFNEKTRQSFRRLVIDGVDAELVAAELGLTLNAVLIAKCRVLKELRRAGQGLLGI
jgi:RNA polymerase sigma-70 factor (ECF subfamily)